MSERLDSERAAYAAERVKEIQKEALKKYRSAVGNAPAYLRQCGLLQLAAFYGSGEDRKPVWGDLWAWLTQASTTKAFFKNGDQNKDALGDRMKVLSGFSSNQLSLLERESEEILGWLKRLTEARNQAEEKNKKKPPKKVALTAEGGLHGSP